MVDPIQQSQRAGGYSDPHERQRILELQWEISLLGCYLAATRKNGQLGAQHSKLKNDLKAGIGIDKIANELNFFIGKINEKIPSDTSPIAPFNFSDKPATQMQSLKCFVTTFEKYLLALKENQQLSPLEGTNFWQEAQSLVSSALTNPRPQEIYHKLDVLIERVNKLLPEELKVPPLPPGLLGARR